MAKAIERIRRGDLEPEASLALLVLADAADPQGYVRLERLQEAIATRAGLGQWRSEGAVLALKQADLLRVAGNAVTTSHQVTLGVGA